jgi:uncharacterized protein YgbK (DUF1537 family)
MTEFERPHEVLVNHMNINPWRILSDDLTGALDSAAAWAGAAEVPVFLERPGPSAQPVQAVVTGTRDVPPTQLPALLAPSLDWFTATGLSFKKIDSLLRGNSLAEIGWLMQSGRFDGAVFAPAFPAQGRFTAQDRHWVAPPHQPQGARSHEFAGSLKQALAAVGLNAQLCADVPQRLPAGDRAVLIPDILDNQALDQLAVLAAQPQARRWLWCASAGLAWALARREGMAGASPEPSPPAPTAGAVLLLTASRHPVLRAQLRQLAFTHHALDLIDLAAPEPLSAEQAHERLSQGMQQIVATHARPDRLVVVGGDTLLALCRAAGVRSLQAGASPRAGWGCARLNGGPWDGVLCYSRSGAFGPADDLAALLATLLIRYA